MQVKGIHHISTIVKHPQENLDFYASFLGLKLIAKSVNFDDANTYHIYLGNHNNDLGTAITFFPWFNNAKEGVIGGGQLGITTYEIPIGSKQFWLDRFKQFKVHYEINKRFNDEYIFFKDRHGVLNELVEGNINSPNLHEFNGITTNNAIKGFAGGLIYSLDPEKSKDFFVNILGLKVSLENERYYRLKLLDNKYLDLDKIKYSRGVRSTKTVHHIAFTVSEEDLIKYKQKLESLNIYVSDIKDRHFFKSIYFKEPGGLIIELATEKPGFYIKDNENIFIPPHLSKIKKDLTNSLVPLTVNEISELKDYPYETKEEYLLYIEHQKMLNRINFLANQSKIRTLTEEELKEQKELRKQYVKNITGGLRTIVDTIYIEDENGNYQKVTKKE